MSGQERKPDQIQEELKKALDEVNEILAKSGYGELNKEDPATQPGADSAEPAPEGEPAPEAAPAPEAEAAPEGEPAPEDGAGEDRGAMEAQAKELSDEELDMMLDILMAEKEQRHAGGEAAPEGEPAAEPAPEGEAAEKSMKSELKKLAKANKKLAKSVEAAVAAMSGMKQDVDALRKSQAAAPAPQAAAPAPAAKPSTVTRAASTRSGEQVQVLRKSTEPTKRLNKSETIDYALGKLRGGDKMVNRDVIAEINLARDEGELAAIQDRMAKQGFVWPDLK